MRKAEYIWDDTDVSTESDAPRLLTEVLVEDIESDSRTRAFEATKTPPLFSPIGSTQPETLRTFISDSFLGRCRDFLSSPQSTTVQTYVFAISGERLWVKSEWDEGETDHWSSQSEAFSCERSLGFQDVERILLRGWWAETQRRIEFSESHEDEFWSCLDADKPKSDREAAKFVYQWAFRGVEESVLRDVFERYSEDTFWEFPSSLVALLGATAELAPTKLRVELIARVRHAYIEKYGSDEYLRILEPKWQPAN